MNSPNSPSPLDKEQARRRREELQKVNMQQQALRIAQQRELSAHKKSAAANKPSTPQKPLAARSVYTPPASPSPPAAPPAPARAEPVMSAPVAPAKREKPVAAPSKHDLEEIRAELKEFAQESPRLQAPIEAKPPKTSKRRVTAKARAPIEEPAPEISVDDLVIDSPNLEEAKQVALPPPPSDPTAVEIALDDLVIESPAVDGLPQAVLPTAPPKAATLKLKLVAASEPRCPKCGFLIQEAQRGAYYTECRKCGEIMKTNAA